MFRCGKYALNTMSHLSQRAALLASMSTRSAAAAAASGNSQSDADAKRIKGAPPVAIEDLYGLLYLSEPTIYALEREPKDMFENDVKLNQCFMYLNGGCNAPRDDRTANAMWELKVIKTIVRSRDAGIRPELRKVLKEVSGSDELPQLYIDGKCVAKGKDFDDMEKVKKLFEPTIRPWPRSGPYQLGFTGYEGITQSDQFHVGTWKPRTTGANKKSE